MDMPTLPELIKRLTHANFPNEDESSIFWAGIILMTAMTPDRDIDEVFDCCFDWAMKAEGLLMKRWYMMACSVASGMRQLSDEDLEFLAACRNPEPQPEPVIEGLDLDIKVKRCLICDGHFDTPTGDYCPRCEFLISEDGGIADFDLHA